MMFLVWGILREVLHDIAHCGLINELVVSYGILGTFTLSLMAVQTAEAAVK